MKTKLFKIGEVANYGKWRMTLKGENVILDGIDYITNETQEIAVFQVGDYFQIQMYLEKNMSYFYADKIVSLLKKWENA